MIELDGFRCCRCGRGSADGVILQVHHALYHANRAPWEYAPRDCETLCKGCHAAEHGHIPPQTGWSLYDDEDLGDLCGTCERCGTALRYVFHISHPHWEPMAVGTDCCDYLTDSELASNKMESIRRFRSRQSRFVISPRWRLEKGAQVIDQGGHVVRVVKRDDGWYLQINTVRGKLRHASLAEAKSAAFEFIDSTKADQYFKAFDRRGKRR